MEETTTVSFVGRQASPYLFNLGSSGDNRAARVVFRLPLRADAGVYLKLSGATPVKKQLSFDAEACGYVWSVERAELATAQENRIRGQVQIERRDPDDQTDLIVWQSRIFEATITDTIQADALIEATQAPYLQTLSVQMQETAARVEAAATALSASLTADAQTLSPGAAATVSIDASSGHPHLSLGIPKGEAGVAGRSIASILRTAGSGAAGTSDTYTITYSDDTTSSFDVFNGANGGMQASVYDANGDGVVGLADAANALSETAAVPQSQVTGLSAALAAKAAKTHTHAQSDITGLASALRASVKVFSVDITSSSSQLLAATSDTRMMGFLVGMPYTATYEQRTAAAGLNILSYSVTMGSLYLALGDPLPEIAIPVVVFAFATGGATPIVLSTLPV